MDAWAAVRRRAREVRASLELPAALDGEVLLGCRELIALALETYGLTQVSYAADDPQLGGARAKLDGPYAIVNCDLPLGLQNFALAHELGHYVLGHQHNASLACTDQDLEGIASGNPFAGGEDLAIYHPRQRIEIEASTFAAELLAPQSMLVRAVRAGMTLAELVRPLQLPERIVINQLIACLLSGGLEEAAQTEIPRQQPVVEGLLKSLDLSQRRAAEWERGPLLVMAGPGTGKTRTLSGRVQFLVERRQVEPRHILVLTFSNKAAQELRDRLAGVLGQRVTALTIETFHAFALELLKRYARLVDLPVGFRIADTLDGYLMLDDRLAELKLEHYTTIWNPGQYLPDLLRAVSRAKDELKSAEEYVRAAQQLSEEATSEKERLVADKAMEVARTYAFYQQLLAEHGVVDYGDLIVKAVHLLEEHAGVQAEVRRQYQHILVDEYQDVNRGCARLLRALAGDGQGLWVVGDLRQSIYQFRGASPANIGEFERDYTNAQRLPLTVNYRSQPLLVKVFSAVAQQMAVDDPSFEPWAAAHTGGDGGTVQMHYTADAESESDLIAQVVQKYQACDIDLRSVAILCRTNAQAEKLARDLEERSVPVAYLGNLFNRREVKQILDLLALAEGGDGSALLGLGDIVEPPFRPADIYALLGSARALSLSFPQALLRSRDIEGLSEAGRSHTEALGKEIERCRFSDGVAEGLVRFLFGERSRFIRRLLQQMSLAAQLKLVAIGELLQLARLFGVRKEAGFPGLARLTFIEYVHRLIGLGEGRLALPPTIDQVDAVRILPVYCLRPWG
ncbi:MAG: UvrD-helicase domain-containing protein [Chloroflexi bacterium]|nr:UvrD-helicase domain-containing protein [Chloroflexota bacterium]